jgi:hypothetical protein
MDLLCYEVEPGRVTIRPASHRRQWMDATPDGYAYRCVPVSAANAQGWEILSPVSVEATWNGGAGVEDIAITFPDGPEGVPSQFIESHFGSGILTFNPLVILRTPEGCDLWVGGTPNEAKDGISPLTAVVEADWMPFPFSMNWRFTRTRHRVRFEQGEPFCFFTPIRRQSIEDFVPQLRPISSDSQLMQTYADGKTRRNVMALLGTDPSARFQGWYARGAQPDGREEPGVAHRTKSRPRPFTRG